MPQLQENSPALCVDGIGDLAPSINLRLRVNPGGILIALSLLRDLRGFGNQQARAGSLAVIGSSKLTRHKAFAGAIARQWGENHAVRQRPGRQTCKG